MTCKERGSSETIRAACIEKISNIDTLSKNRYSCTKNPQLFEYWLAGLIDADGCLLVSKAGYASCEITVGEKEWQTLALIKKKIGGSIKKRSGVKALRWRLHNISGMKELVTMINGKLLLEKRKHQFKNVCNKLSIDCQDSNDTGGDNLRAPKLSSLVSDTKPLNIYKNAWLAGFFEGEGYFHLNKSSFQLSVTVSQKDKSLLDKIAYVMNGHVFYDRSWDGWFYSASKIDDIALWVNYFSKFPLISWKQIQLQRFKRLLLYKSKKLHLKKQGKPWQRFKRLVGTF